MFDTSAYMPHGHCYLWQPAILWMHVGSDALIGLSYFSIPVAMSFYIRKAKLVGGFLSSVLFLFILFILLCGATHFFAIWTTWHPNYFWEGVLKVLTAIASVVTAAALWPLIPMVLKIPSPQELRNSNDKLSDLNNSLEQKIKEGVLEAEKKASDLEASNKRFKTFHDLTTGREAKMIDLKREINELCSKLGEPSRYKIVPDEV